MLNKNQASIKTMYAVGVVILYDQVLCVRKVLSRESNKGKQPGRPMRICKVNNKLDRNKIWWKGID